MLHCLCLETRANLSAMVLAGTELIFSQRLMLWYAQDFLWKWFPPKLIKNLKDITRYCCCPLHSCASKGAKRHHALEVQHDERAQRGLRMKRKMRKNVLEDVKLSQCYHNHFLFLMCFVSLSAASHRKKRIRQWGFIALQTWEEFLKMCTRLGSVSVPLHGTTPCLPLFGMEPSTPRFPVGRTMVNRFLFFICLSISPKDHRTI